MRRLLGALALCVAAGAGAQTPGFLIVAKPSLRDPNFARTVVLVAQTPEGAALGVILNRPATHSLASILPGNAKLARFTEPLYFGGPVEEVGLFAVFTGAEPPGESFQVRDDLYIALAPATVEGLMDKPPDQLRFYTGYAGWGPDQLQGELDRGDWWVMEPDPDVAFRKDTSTLWDELATRARAITAKAF